MGKKARIALLSGVLFAASCTSGGDQPGDGGQTGGEPPSPSQAVRQVGVFEVMEGCSGLGRLHRAQLSFVFEGELFLATSGASAASCAFEVRRPVDLEWGPEGDRLHFGDLRRSDGDRLVSLPDDARSIAWSRPSGTSVVYVSDGRLMKVDAFGDEPFDISFLSDHDEVVYHPAGTHVAVTGTADDGTYGVWLATNLGEGAQLLAIGEDARRIFSLAFAHNGRTLYYAAEHADHYDVHSLKLATQDAEGEVRDAKLGTLDSSSGEMGDVVVSEFTNGAVAYTVGSCEENKATRVWSRGVVTEVGGELAGPSTQPVGWLPNGELLVLARAAGCEGEGTLFSWSPERTARIVSGVSVAGVRAHLPPPPEPPGSKQQTVA